MGRGHGVHCTKCHYVPCREDDGLHLPGVVQLLREEPPKKVLKSDTAAEDLPEDSQEVATECQSDTDSQKTLK